jgi:hypothetical protein
MRRRLMRSLDKWQRKHGVSISSAHRQAIYEAFDV